MRALFAATLLAAGCARCTSPSFALRPVEPGPAPAPFPVALRVLHFGDFGEDTIQHRAVGRAMAEFARVTPLDLALSVGDNIYECGPELNEASTACTFEPDGNTAAKGFVPPPDSSFQMNFEASLEGLRRGDRPVPVWVVLGNHDVNAWGTCSVGTDPDRAARARACLEVAHHSPRWSMPGRHWLLDEGPARFIAIDSNLLARDYGGFSFDDEVAFVRGAAAACGEKLCFLVAHHPSVSAGEHREVGPQYLARVKRIEEAFGGRLAAWLAGHEHQLEHLRAEAGYDVLLSGNTARGRAQERFEKLSAPGAKLLFASTAWGFGVLEVGEGRWAYRFVNDGGLPTYCCFAIGRGPCAPVACSR